MQHSSKTRTWANDDDIVQPLPVDNAVGNTDKTEETSEKVTENPVKKPKVKVAASRGETQEQAQAPEAAGNDTMDTKEDSAPIDDQENQPKSDADWLRSKTSRLLGLLDEEEQAEVKAPSPVSEDDSDEPAKSKIQQQEESPEPQDSYEEEEEVEEERDYDADVELIRTSGRLFLRNLAYGATETDLEPVFAPFGKIDEVSCYLRTITSTLTL